MRAPVATAFAIIFGLVVLVGYFLPATLPANLVDPRLRDARTYIIDWAAILASFVTLIAVLGLVSNHWNKLRARRNPDRYSFFMLAAFVLTVIFGIIAYVVNGDIAGFQRVVMAIQVPVEASMMALLALTLTLASLRLFRRRRGLLPWVFFISVLLFLLLNSGLLTSQVGVPIIDQFLGALRLLPVAGGRGILLGIALGSLMAGLRVLIGADRPYSG